jgi:hypothetical protein
VADRLKTCSKTANAASSVPVLMGIANTMQETEGILKVATADA